MSLAIDNKRDAITYRDELADRLDGITETASDPVFDALQSLRSTMVQDISTRIANLPAVVEYVPSENLPAGVLAYRLYGDATRADEIVSRNKITHPGFVPNGQPIEYLK